MKTYEKILKQLELDAENDTDLANELIIDVSVWRDFNEKLKNKYPSYSEEYWYFLNNYHCPFLGCFDIFLTCDNTEGDENLIDYNIEVTDNLIPKNTLIPIAGIGSQFIFLNEKGQVIQFINVASKVKQSNFFTDVPREDYENSCDIAYLSYPDVEGFYKMYRVLAMSFDQFLDECIFGERYLEFSDPDAFYRHIRNVKKELGINDEPLLKRFRDGSIYYSIGKQINDGLNNSEIGAIIDINFKTTND